MTTAQTIAVTGSSGYLGSRVLARLTTHNIPAIGLAYRGSADINCDLTRDRSIQHLLGDAIVIHCAAVVPKSSQGYHDEDAAANSLRMVANVLAAAPRHLIFASSMTVYGPCPLPVMEADAGPPGFGYAGAKRRAELLIEKSGCSATILRLAGLFGLPRKAGLLYNAVLALKQERRFPLPDWLPLWAPLNVDDAADIVMRAALGQTPRGAVAMNVGYPGMFSITDALAEIAELLDTPLPKALSPAPPFSMNLSRLSNAYGLPDAGWRQRLTEFVSTLTAVPVPSPPSAELYP